MPSRAPLRVLVPEDAVDPASIGGLGRQLQMLIAHGDLEFVRGIAWQVDARVRWLLESADDHKNVASFALAVVASGLL